MIKYTESSTVGQDVVLVAVPAFAEAHVSAQLLLAVCVSLLAPGLTG